MQSEPTRLSRQYPRVLSIAGSDSGGGAGIQADLKTLSALGCHGMTAITAVTAQNTLGVTALHAVPAAIVKAQIAAVFDDIGVDAVKIGMLHSPQTVHVVAEALARYGVRHVVLDPVMLATSGAVLMAPEAVDAMVRELFPRASVVTPNLHEAALLLGRAVNSITRIDQLDDAARDLLALGAPAVLLKGGHLEGDTVVDVLAAVNVEWRHLQSPRIASRNLHGTGCTLASAIAAHLALGHALDQAVVLARRYILQAIAGGADVRTGAGDGPLNHGHAPVPMHKRPRS
ncbi:MAG: bifunctional hydroxymethylpyrimidine kinase/phosphomethylpyrimidine kinase [Bacteriovorax sp.]|nr:bifunctional hydroxymethylpyrimidine kinase/phosphomethylpyrimidine kinase [Rhizobacter sp.]